MRETTLPGRILVRRDTTAHWNAARGFIPMKGEVIVYTDHISSVIDGQTVYEPGIKIGSGNGYVQDLAFVGDETARELLAHINNTTAHITAQERIYWNNKLNVDDDEEVIEEALILNRN